MRNDPKTGELVALDPSIRSAGIALYRAGVLTAAATIKVDADDSDIAARCLRMSVECARWIGEQRCLPHTLVVEWPQWYDTRGGGRKKKETNPNDLAGLAAVNGAVAGICALWTMTSQRPIEVVSFTPHAWAGTQPKTKTVTGAKFSPRARNVMSRLTDAELAVWHAAGSSHDAIDAIGIGLKALGRYERQRLLPGAT